MADATDPSQVGKPLDYSGGGGPAPGLTQAYAGRNKTKSAADSGTPKTMAFSPYSNSAFAPGSMYSAFNPPLNNPYA